MEATKPVSVELKLKDLTSQLRHVHASLVDLNVDDYVRTCTRFSAIATFRSLFCLRGRFRCKSVGIEDDWIDASRSLSNSTAGEEVRDDNFEKKIDG